MNIRDASKEELPIIREQRLNAYREHAQAISKEHWQGLEQAISSDVDVQPGVDLIVAEIDEKIVGSVALFPPKTAVYEGYINEIEYSEIRVLAVSPEARGKGVASALISECIQRTKAKGYDTIGLHTAEFMKSAVKLYERIGFERLPQHDFEPANDGVTVKAYRLSI